MQIGGEEWFMHTLALALGGMTVAEMKTRMGAGEYERWRQYYLDAPFDDAHRYYRPAALVATMAGKIGKGLDYFIDILQPPKHQHSDADMSVFKAFGIKPRR